MDESLSDFKESKQSCKGPKASQKTSKPKAKKVNKRIKGQSDIRKVLKGKKNELISYSKEFDTVCKKSGLDVDSEQLQLAIALSKSLYTGALDDACTSQSLTTQGRIAKIKTTLQEYGFKVPETKIAVTSKRKRKLRRDYKLLTTTEEERHEKISSKYSQIIFETLDCSNLEENPFNQEYDTQVYYIGTHLEYEHMRDSSIFYVENLVEKSNTSGCLFRDWSKIPGRPISPILFETNTMSFSEIMCSQEELDVILSGCIKSAKHILASKVVKTSKQNDERNIQQGNIDHETKQVADHRIDGVDCNQSTVINEDINVAKESKFNQMVDEERMPSEAAEVIDIEIQSTTTLQIATEKYRSCSPDIFDDEVSGIMETKPVVLSQGQRTKMFTEETNGMDITECIDNDIPKDVDRTELIISNVTKRKSDDFMEITECAVSASQGIREIVKEIDLTQSPDEKSIIIGTKPIISDGNDSFDYVAESPDCSLHEEVMIAGNFVSKDHQVPQDGIVLTQKYDDSTIILDENQDYKMDHSKSIINENSEILSVDDEAIKDVQLSPKDNIDLTQSSNASETKLLDTEENSHLEDKRCETMDLTLSSKSSVDIDELPEVNIGNTQAVQTDLDDTIILNEEEYKDINGKVKKSIIFQDNQVFDLTQATDNDSEQPENKTKEGNSKLCSQSFYEDFEYDHSDNRDNMCELEINEDSHKTSKVSNDIDLTQSSNESTRNSLSPRPVPTFENIPNNSSLGKRDEISIDYDEICEYESDKETATESNCNDTHNGSLSLKNDSSKSSISNNLENIENNNDLVSNCSQNSEVFDLTDKELDYSLYKSRLDIPVDNYNFDFGGISVMDDVPGVRPFKESLDHRESIHNARESFLPEVYVKKTEDKCVKTAEPLVAIGNSGKNEVAANSVSIVTPKNSEYIVKTDNVTPMLDYTSMTTPQRNKELDKYGLKPFKRKRGNIV